MLLAIIYIGIAQCLFSALLVFSKRPLEIADKILGSWLLVSSLLFIYLFFKDYFNFESIIWPVSLALMMIFPEFLVLYSKYITTEHQRFKKRDLLFFTPVFILVIVTGIYFILKLENTFFINKDSDDQGWVPSTLNYLFFASVWVYSLIAFYFVIRYKNRISHNYSFESHRINLSWLYTVILVYFLTYNFLFLVSRNFFLTLDYSKLLSLINGAQLIFIFILSYFGFMQQQLHSDNKSVVLSRFVFKESTIDTYQKSGLKDSDRIKENLKILIDFMNSSEPWKDSELTVAKLSEFTGIPKHYITQILNDNLQKNFYTFVNEYRTEYAKKLIISPKHSHLSILAIGFESGFNSKTAFYGFFSKYTGMTPSEYKKLHS